MPDLVKALLSDMISGLSAEELRNVIMKTAENHFEDIGKAALEEKGKRNVDPTKVIAPEVDMIEEDGAAGVVIVGRKEGEAVIEEELQVLAETAASPEDKKRKREIIEISDDESDPLGDITIAIPPAVANPHIPQRMYGPQTKKLYDLLERVPDGPKERLCRMAGVLDTMDWSGISDKRDLNGYLLRTEREICLREDIDMKTSISTPSAMQAFLNRHYTKLVRYSPALAAFVAPPKQPSKSCRQVGGTLKKTMPSGPQNNTHIAKPPSPPARLDRIGFSGPRPAPPLDWGPITAEISLLDILEIDDYLRALVNDFRTAYKSILAELAPKSADASSMSAPITITRIIQLINRMALLATNMFQARPQKVLNTLMDDLSLSRLRACMLALCQSLLKQDPKAVKSTIDEVSDGPALVANVQKVWIILRKKDESQELRDQYSSFLAFLNGVYGGSLT